MPRKNPEEDKEYQRRYYLKRKADLQAERAERYKKDPEYRNKQKTRSRRQHWLKRRPEAVEKKEALFAPSVVTDTPVATLRIQIKDRKDARHGQVVMVPVFTAKAAAGIVRRTVQTWRVWEDRGVVPRPTYRNSDMSEGLVRGANARLYTADELEAIRKAAPLLAMTHAATKDSAFSRKLHEYWGELTQGVWRVEK